MAGWLSFHDRTTAVIAGISGLLAAGIVLATYSAVMDARERRIENAVSDSKNISSLIRANFERVVESIDLQIDEFVREFGGGRSEEDVQAFFRARRYPASVVQIAVADGKGTMVASNLRYPVEKVSLADREHFRVHADGKVSGTFISKPVRGRISGVWTLNITRALKVDGQFAGMVVFAYDLADFTHFYDGLDVGSRGIVSMTGLDGVVRVRSGSTEFFGADVSQSPSFQRMRRDFEGTYDGTSAVDRIRRVGYFAGSKTIPMIFLVAYDHEAILGEAALGEALMWGGCALLVLLIFAGAAGVGRQIRERERRRGEEVEQLVEERNGALLDAVRSVPGLVMAVVAPDGTIVSSNVGRPASAAALPSGGPTEAPPGNGERLSWRLDIMALRIGGGVENVFPAHIVDRFVDALGRECEVIWAAARIPSAIAALSPGDSRGGGFIILGLDNTEQRRQESQIIHMSKLATLGEVATGMAHELNQPLNVIRMAAENATGRIAATTDDGAYVRSKLERISAQVERAAKIIDHMRIFGRRSGATAAQHDLWLAVEGAVNILGEQLRLAGIAVKLHGAAGLCEIACDQALMEQVIINLLLNARDAIVARSDAAASAGRNWIEVAMEIDRAAGGMTRARLTVSDSGGGIPEKVLPRLFEPFFTTKPVGKGTGLGLSVSYGIVRDLGGRLSAANVGEGARFEIDAPCTLAGAAPADVASA